jgi:hypothetical protein
LKELRESEKAPSELDSYFDALNVTKMRQEEVKDVIEKLVEALEYDDNLPARERLHLRQYLDRPFDPDQNHEYASLPKRKVSTLVEVPWTVAAAKSYDHGGLFPNGLGLSQREEQNQWQSRKREKTRKMIIADVVKEYFDNPKAFRKIESEQPDEANEQQVRDMFASKLQLLQRVRDR